jgi:hypothetical protein
MKKTIITLSLGVMAFSVLVISACKKEQPTNPDEQDTSGIVKITASTVNLSGKMEGTLLSGKTYFLRADLIIPEGKEIVVQPGVTVIAEQESGDIGPEITIEGSLICEGTQTNPILFSVPESKRGEANVFKGYWGGFQCRPTARLLMLRWVRMEYLGGEGGPGSPRAGSVRYAINTLSPDTEVLLEDSRVYGCKDDVFRPNSGKVNLVRNTFEFCGENGGDGLNVKAGTVGNIAFNLFIGGATNAFKPSNEGSSTVQTNINVYNNTILNSGWRRPGMSRGANINYEVGARGYAYNNIIVNCKRGMRVLADADLQNIKFDNNLYYATHNEMAAEFIPSDAVASTTGVLGTNNIYGAAKENNPMFENYAIDAFSIMQFEAGETQPADMNKVGTSNFRLKAGSPCLGKGKTDFSPVTVNWVYAVGSRAPSIMQPSIDLGAYPSNGNGNKHN